MATNSSRGNPIATTDGPPAQTTSSPPHVSDSLKRAIRTDASAGAAAGGGSAGSAGSAGLHASGEDIGGKPAGGFVERVGEGNAAAAAVAVGRQAGEMDGEARKGEEREERGR